MKTISMCYLLAAAVIFIFLILFAVAFIRAQLVAEGNKPLNRKVFIALIVTQYTLLIVVICIHYLKPYTLYGDGGWGINFQIKTLLSAAYILILFTAFNYEKFTIQISFWRIFLYILICTLIVFGGLSASEHILSDVQFYAGVKYYVYTHSRRVTEFVIVLIPTFLVFYCFSKNLFFTNNSIRNRLFYSILPVLLLYCLAISIYLKYEMMNANEREAVQEEIGIYH